MGLSGEQALNQDLNYLSAAYIGYVETMEHIFGTADDDEVKQKPGKPAQVMKTTKDARGEPIMLSPSIFDVQFGGKAPGIRRKVK